MLANTDQQDFSTLGEQLRNLVVQLQRTYPNARATKEAAELAEKYGVTVK